MAKNSKKRKTAPDPRLTSIAKKLKPEDRSTELVAAAVTPPSIISQGAGIIGGLVYEDELETTTDTLLTLARNPSLLSLKALKPFKTAVHDYWRVAHETSNTGACISARALTAG